MPEKGQQLHTKFKWKEWHKSANLAVGTILFLIRYDVVRGRIKKCRRNG